MDSEIDADKQPHGRYLFRSLAGLIIGMICGLILGVCIVVFSPGFNPGPEELRTRATQLGGATCSAEIYTRH